MGNSIVVCGKKLDIGTRVVLWDEPNGLNSYDTTKYIWEYEDRKTGKIKKRVISGKRYKNRIPLNNPSLTRLQGLVSQFFLHHSGLYRSITTFNVLHKERGLSCHFLLDEDGTIYQCLDLKEKAQHGGLCNPMSIGIEIDSRADADRFPNAYSYENQIKYGVGPRGKKVDFINGEKVTGYEYNNSQYQSLIKLAIGLCNIFPIIGTNMDFPRDSDGLIIKRKISKPKDHLGFICHFHSNNHKVDPIAFDFDRFLSGVNPNQPLSLDQDFNPKVEWDFDNLIIKPKTVLNNWFGIQYALTNLGYNVGPLDGVFGDRTKKALIDFQAKNGLSVDGVFGPQTKSKMEELLNV